MLTRKFYTEEDILNLFNEEVEEKEATEVDSEESPSLDDIDLESLSAEEKVSFAKEVLKSIEGVSDDAQEKINEIIDELDSLELEEEEEEEDEYE